MRTVWIVGSSIIRNAFFEARSSFSGANLGLQRNNCRVRWLGKGGLKWDDLVPRVKFLLSYDNPPDYMVIHCAANSIGQINLFDFRSSIYFTVEELKMLMPRTVLIWSQILPRLAWRYCSNCKAMNLSAVRLNSYAASLIVKSGGHYIKYPEISWNNTQMFSDNVHLSPLGNSFFLYHLQSSLLAITESN